MAVELDPCAEWRLLASCELDAELSELDAVRLEHHLADCGACRAWLTEGRELATALRTAELEAPERSIDLSATRRRMFRASTVAAAAAASVAAAALAILPLAHPSGRAMHAALAAHRTKRGACPMCLPRKFALLSINGQLNRQTPGRGAVVS